MRKITAGQIMGFFVIFATILVSSALIVHNMAKFIPLVEYRSIFIVFGFFALSQFFSLSSYRIMLSIFPLPEGNIEMNSKEETIYHFHLLFYLMFFHVVIVTKFLPMPLMVLYYRDLGTTIGQNSFSGGKLLDGIFITIGDNTIIGEDSILTPHQIENEKLAHYPITIGNNVTVGAGAMILPGVTIEDDALISANAVVTKGTHIKRGEIWGGIPARKISDRELEKPVKLSA